MLVLVLVLVLVRVLVLVLVLVMLVVVLMRAPTRTERPRHTELDDRGHVELASDHVREDRNLQRESNVSVGIAPTRAAPTASRRCDLGCLRRCA